MKKSVITLLLVILALSLTACGGASGSDSGSAAQLSPVTGDVINASLPDTWCLVTGTDMLGSSGADFICHAAEYSLGDPYLQVEKDSRTIEKVQELLEGTDPYGEYYGTAELANGTWYLAENASAAVIGDSVCFVKCYNCDFQSDEVQAILGSISWIG